MADPASGSPTPPRKTPLAAAHVREGAKLIDFGGWLMPVSYPQGILKEHAATRTAVGVFDVSHMGEFHVRGPGAAAALGRVVTNDVSQLADGKALYTVACTPSGGIVDDLIVYRLESDHFLVIVNASNIDKDFLWFLEATGETPGVSWENASDDIGLIAFQGPAAEVALQALTPTSLAELGSFHIATGAQVGGRTVHIARTGYTGEDGFELVCHTDDLVFMWDLLVDAARKVGGSPVGLGARDTLRLEARLPLYGNDLLETTSPLEAGLGWVVKLKSGVDFIGREALLAEKASGSARKLVGLVMQGRGIARQGYAVLESAEASAAQGVITSGTVGPTVGKNIALAYVPTRLSAAGTRLVVDCRGKHTAAEVIDGPFYRRKAAQ